MTASTKKKVTWSDEVHITLDAEAAHYPATQHADVFAITDQEQIIPVSLAIPAEPPAVPNAEQAEPAASTKEPTPNMPVQTPPAASAEATQRVQGGQTLTTLCTQQQSVNTNQEVPGATPRVKRHRRKLFYSPYRK